MFNSKIKIPACLDIFIVLPDQLFFTKYALQCLKNAEYIYVIEAPEFFTKNAHENKIKYFREAMKNYIELLKKYFKPANIKYVRRAEFEPANTFFEAFSDIKARIMMFQIADIYNFKNIKEKKTNGLYIKFFMSPGFLFSEELLDIIKNVGGFTAFYKLGRKLFTKKINPRINGKFEPLGGSFKLSSIKKEIAAAPREIKEFPTNHAAAFKQFKNFCLGNYKNELAPNLLFFSSGISPALNCGLLTPFQILSELIEHNDINIYELFMRHIFMREYIRALYYLKIEVKKKNKIKINTAHAQDLIDYVLQHSYMNDEGRKIIFQFFIEEKKSKKYIINWFRDNFIDGRDWSILPIYGLIFGGVKAVVEVMPRDTS